MVNPIWGAVGFLSGILAFVGVPILLGPILPIRYRQRIIDMYGSLMTMAFDRCLVVPREVQGLDLMSSHYDPKLGREAVEIGDEERAWRDPGNRLGRLYGRPFAIAPAFSEVLVDVLDCAMAECDARADDEHGTTDEVSIPTADGPTTVEATRLETALPTGACAWPVGGIRHIKNSESDSSAADRTVQVVENSQAGYKSRSVVDYMVPLIFALAGGILGWFLKTQGGNIGGALPIDGSSFLIDVVGVLA